MTSFKSFNLPEALLKSLTQIGFETPTPIQTQAIPLGLQGKDLIACAQTGTGKTAAFCLPILTRMLDTTDPKNAHITALVLAPTRELALQIDAFWNQLTRFSPQMHSACLIGGASMGLQMRALSRRPRMVIATPGRLLDHLQRNSVSLANSSLLVLDEADRMLDMGFEPQLAKILRYLPKVRQNFLFSATWDSSLDKLSQNYLRNPSRISVGETSKAASTIDQKLVSTTSVGKNEALLDELNASTGSVLVFARTQARTDRLTRYLQSYGMECGRIHGGRSQPQRVAALEAFRSGKMRVLIATDIASRGIDVTGIAQVINYDLPMKSEDYIHRIGRTGRAGMAGEALSFVTPEDRASWNDIARLLKKAGSQVPEAVQHKHSGKSYTRVAGAPSQEGPSYSRHQDPRRRGQRPNSRPGNRPQGGGRPDHRNGHSQGHGQGQRQDQGRHARPMGGAPAGSASGPNPYGRPSEASNSGNSRSGFGGHPNRKTRRVSRQPSFSNSPKPLRGEGGFDN